MADSPGPPGEGRRLVADRESSVRALRGAEKFFETENEVVVDLTKRFESETIQEERENSPTEIEQGSPTEIEQSSPTEIEQGSPTEIEHGSPTEIATETKLYTDTPASSIVLGSESDDSPISHKSSLKESPRPLEFSDDLKNEDSPFRVLAVYDNLQYMISVTWDLINKGSVVNDETS